MYLAVVVCVLIAAVSARQSPLEMLGKPTLPKMRVALPEPKKCCAQPYYTVKSSNIIVSMHNGTLLTDVVGLHGAYDSMGKRIGLKVVEDLSNGTEYTFRLISDFKTGVGYVIYKVQEGEVCFQFDIESPFPYNCVPDESKYVNSVSVGDRALQSDQWYYNDKISADEDAHVVLSIKSPECIDLGYVSRVVHPTTGVELETDTNTVFDFSLGICDPDVWFKPPAECEPPTLKKSKTIPKHLIGLRGPGGKRLFK